MPTYTVCVHGMGCIMSKEVWIFVTGTERTEGASSTPMTT